jgi:hypothetical protein
VLTGAVAFLGGLTYPLYLLHENIGYALWFDLPVRRRLRRAIGEFIGTTPDSAR